MQRNYGTHVQFTVAGDSVTGFTIRINRDEFTAKRVLTPLRP